MSNSNANTVATTVTTTVTTKVVINACYGGFGLSAVATKWMAECGDEEAAAHLADEDNYWGDGEFDQYRPRCARHDPLLIACVEALGEVAASGMYAELRVSVVEGDKYHIDSNDGAERLVTPALIPWVQV
jgi:hypothetical protein